jgi:hypothetical protein
VRFNLNGNKMFVRHGYGSSAAVSGNAVQVLFSLDSRLSRLLRLERKRTGNVPLRLWSSAESASLAGGTSSTDALFAGTEPPLACTKIRHGYAAAQRRAARWLLVISVETE